MQVVVSPERHSSVITFRNRASSTDDNGRARLSAFQHVEGARVHKDLFKPYNLPNGRQVRELLVWAYLS